jgi:hypothetical protein
MRRFTVFCNEEGIASLFKLRFTTWIARLRAFAARNMQPYLCAINTVFSRPRERACGARTTSTGRAPWPRHATTTHRRPGRSRLDPTTRRTTYATTR